MTVYEFYALDKLNEFHFIGMLPERRRDPIRITEESVINWARQFLGNAAGMQDIFFGTVKLKKI